MKVSVNLKQNGHGIEDYDTDRFDYEATAEPERHTGKPPREKRNRVWFHFLVVSDLICVEPDLWLAGALGAKGGVTVLIQKVRGQCEGGGGVSGASLTWISL